MKKTEAKPISKPTPEGGKNRKAAPVWPQWVLPVFLLLAAFCLRMAYAHDLPMNLDEIRHLKNARMISVRAGAVNLPLGSEKTNHPVLVLYITRLADWIGSGSIGFIRFVFVLVNMTGLVGVFFLARFLFDDRIACFALFLAALDHHLISYAPQFLEPVYLNLAPWILLAFYQAVEQGQKRRWFLVGALFGIGFLLTEVIVLLTLPLALFLPVSRKIGRALRTPQLYAGIGVFLLVISPYLIWTLATGANIGRHAERAGSFGLTPRFLLLYIGDFLIGFRDSAWIVLTMAHEMYMPTAIPSHWITGLAYLACVLYCLRFRKDLRHALLLLVFFSIGPLVSVLNAREPWNEFGWASLTVFPAIILAAVVASRLWETIAGRIATSAAFVAFAFFAFSFAFGPKFGYASPFWEKRFLGKMWALEYENRPKEELRAEVEKALKNHPNSPLVQCYRFHFARDQNERNDAIHAIRRLDPGNPLFIRKEAGRLLAENKQAEARDLLRSLLESGHRSYWIYGALAAREFDLRNYAEVEKHARSALAKKPDDLEMVRFLYFALDGLGRTDEAEEALQTLLNKGYLREFEGYAEISRIHTTLGNFEKAGLFAEKAVSGNPEEDAGHIAMGSFLEAVGKDNEALESFLRAVNVAPRSLAARLSLAGWYLRHGNRQKALDSFREAQECALAAGDNKEALRIQEVISSLSR